MRWSTTADRSAVTLVAALCIAAATPLAAQQAASPAPLAGASAVPTTSPGAPLPGPRLRPEWQPVEPSFADNSEPAPMAATTTAAGSNTITISTLALVLVVIIIVLLVT